MAEEILYSREESKRRGGESGRGRVVDYDADPNLDKDSDSKFSLDPAEKTNNYEKIKRLVSQENIETEEEFTQIAKNIKDLVDNNTINNVQGKMLTRRLNENKGNMDKEATFSGRTNTFESSSEIKADIVKKEKKLLKKTTKLADLILDPVKNEQEIAQLEKKIRKGNNDLIKRRKEFNATESAEGVPSQQKDKSTNNEEEVIVEDDNEIVTNDEEEVTTEDELVEDSEQTEKITEETTETKDDIKSLTTDEIMDIIKGEDGITKFSIPELIAEGIIDEEMNIVEVMSVDDFFNNENNIC